MNSNSITYKVPPGIYTNKCISEVVYTKGDHDGTMINEYDNISMKTKLILTPTKDEIHLKCDVYIGSVVNRIRQPIIYSFVLDKPSGFRLLCEPETMH